ncbi:MAG TPA: sulfotransferase [Victivallales bacterium]|nr:sulfotransferase [Victivallales bacterium]
MEDLNKIILKRVFAPSVIVGIKFDQWINTLKNNKFSIDLPYIPRAIATTNYSIYNSLCSFIEHVKFGKQIAKVKHSPPVFILGHWRSGTTLLQNMLSVDKQLVTPTTLQVFQPNSFLLNKNLTIKLFGKFLSNTTRPMDNLAANFTDPLEDEFALCSMTGMSIYMGWAFGKNRDEFEKYLTFNDIDNRQINIWINALQTFVKKIVFNDTNRIPLLKSPPHTGKIKYLLEAFPNAKFIKIHRHPFDVFKSTKNMLIKVAPWMQLQHFKEDGLDDLIVNRYKTLHKAFFEQKSLIPENNYCEISYKNITQKPLETINKIYTSLNISNFDNFKPELNNYLTSIESYKKNVYSDLACDIKKRLKKEWAETFRIWNYD